MPSLQDILESRDNRCARQMELLKLYPACTLICFTVQLPGPEKRNALSLEIARKGVEALRGEFAAPLFEEERDLETGFEAFLVVDGRPEEVKSRCCRIEDSHPLGRLMDIDVIERGEPPVPLSRNRLGLPERKCLICGRPVRLCMREKSHSYAELLQKIAEMVDSC